MTAAVAVLCCLLLLLLVDATHGRRSQPPVQRQRQRRLDKGKAATKAPGPAPAVGVLLPPDSSWLDGGSWTTVDPPTEEEGEDDEKDDSDDPPPPETAPPVVPTAPPTPEQDDPVANQEEDSPPIITYPDPTYTTYDRATICAAATNNIALPTDYSPSVPYAYAIQANDAFAPNAIPQAVAALLRKEYIACNNNRRYLQQTTNDWKTSIVSIASDDAVLLPTAAASGSQWRSAVLLYTDSAENAGSMDTSVVQQDIAQLFASGKVLEYAQQKGISSVQSISTNNNNSPVAAATVASSSSSSEEEEEQKSSGSTGLPRWGQAVLSVGCLLLLAGTILGSLLWYYGDADHNLQFKMLSRAPTARMNGASYLSQDNSSSEGSDASSSEEDDNDFERMMWPSAKKKKSKAGTGGVRVDEPMETSSCAGFGTEMVLEDLPHAPVQQSRKDIAKTTLSNIKKTFFTPLTLPHEQEILPEGETTHHPNNDDDTRSAASSSIHQEQLSLPSFRNLTPRTIAAQQRLYDVPDTVQL